MKCKKIKNRKQKLKLDQEILFIYFMTYNGLCHHAFTLKPISSTLLTDAQAPFFKHCLFKPISNIAYSILIS